MKDPNEKVLVIPKQDLNLKEHSSDIHKFELLINNYSDFKLRSSMEEDENYLQIIPYIVVKYIDIRGTPNIFTYRRLKGSGEARLHSKYSIGIGGHINPGSSFDIPYAYMFSEAMREIEEELTTENPSIKNLSLLLDKNYLIYIEDTPVDRVHLGVMMQYNAPSHLIWSKEVDKIEGSLKSLDNLKNGTFDFENWSKKVLQCI